MAFNKYKRLIEMGAEGFTQREWAVIHLNQGICLQFQEQYQQALEVVKLQLSRSKGPSKSIPNMIKRTIEKYNC